MHLCRLVGFPMCTQVSTAKLHVRTARAARKQALCAALARSGEMSANEREIDALATNMVVVTTYWLSYEFSRNARRFNETQYQSDAMARGAFQALSLVAPFLSPDGKALFERLALEYLQK